MNKILLTTLLLIGSISLISQIEISETFNGTDISGSVIDVVGSPSADDIEHGLYVTNISDQSISIKVRRFEEDVVADTYNNICWLICPATPQYAGENPDWTTTFTVNLEPGQVDSSFAIHYDPNGYSACSVFRVQWVDSQDNDEVFDEVFFRIIHGSEDCAAVGIEELSQDFDFLIAPNPADGQAVIEIDGLDGQVSMVVLDVLGQVVREENFDPAINRRTTLNTSAMRNGIYFVSIADNSRTLKTLKLVVKH